MEDDSQQVTKRGRGSNSPEELALRARVGERIRGLRLEQGLRLADVAMLSGLSEPHLSRLEHGQRWPSVKVIVNLSGIFGVDPSSLLTTSGAPAFTVSHQASAIWHGREPTGSGVMTSRSARVDYGRASRLALDQDDNNSGVAGGSPEELIGMALAGSFSMALARQVESAGFDPRTIHTTADVEIAASASGHAISKIHLRCDAAIDGIDEQRLREIAQLTTRMCVVGRALIGVEVGLEMHLVETSEATTPQPVGPEPQQTLS